MKTLNENGKALSKPLAISFSGSKGSGKDTATEHVVNELKLRGISVRHTSFAKALYKEVSNAFGVPISALQDRKFKDSPRPEMALKNCTNPEFSTPLLEVISALASICHRDYPEEMQQRIKHGGLNSDDPIHPRIILQVWGTEYRRHQKQSYWTDQVAQEINSDRNAIWLFSDARFDSEKETIFENCETHLIRVYRSDIVEDDQQIISSKPHQSEVEWRLWKYSEHITNEFGKKGEFLEKVLKIVDSIIDNYLVHKDVIADSHPTKREAGLSLSN